MNARLRSGIARHCFLACIVLSPLLACAEGGQPQSAIPFKRDPEPVESSLSRLLAGLAACAVAGGIGLYALRRKGMGRKIMTERLDALQILQTRPLAPGIRLHIVQMDETRYLLATGPHGITTIGTHAVHDRGDMVQP